MPGNHPVVQAQKALSQRDKECDDILELNRFDGLSHSSGFRKWPRERKELPAWKARWDFMDTLAKGQFVNVSGSALNWKEFSSEQTLLWPRS